MTQRELISLLYQHMIYINLRTSKKDIIKLINKINENPQNYKQQFIDFSDEYNRITLSLSRDKKLKKLGL
jgi:hypothetical protein